MIGLKMGLSNFNRLYFINKGKKIVVNKNIVIRVGNKFENINLFVFLDLIILGLIFKNVN